MSGSGKYYDSGSVIGIDERPVLQLNIEGGGKVLFRKRCFK
jgi:hypothetical protein